jgi:hypothetical protein
MRTQAQSFQIRCYSQSHIKVEIFKVVFFFRTLVEFLRPRNMEAVLQVKYLRNKVEEFVLIWIYY